jgi:hypothetical protein
LTERHSIGDVLRDATVAHPTGELRNEVQRERLCT